MRWFCHGGGDFFQPCTRYYSSMMGLKDSPGRFCMTWQTILRKPPAVAKLTPLNCMTRLFSPFEHMPKGEKRRVIQFNGVSLALSLIHI